MHQAGRNDIVGRDGNMIRVSRGLRLFYSFTDLHSIQTAAVLSLEKRLVFLSQYSEISGVIGMLKLDCEGCVYPWCIVDFP